MADDDRTGGFDDWLEEEPGPDTDPVAPTTADDDDAEAEIADWMAFTQGTDATPETTDEIVVDVRQPSVVETPTPDDEPTAEIDLGSVSDEVVAGEGSDVIDGIDDGEPDDLDRITQMPVIRPTDVPHAPATTVDLDEFDGGGRADTDEIPIVAAADVVALGSVVDDDPPPPDDTGELDVVEASQDDGPPESSDRAASSDDAEADDLHDTTGGLDAFLGGDTVPNAAAAEAPIDGDDAQPDFFDITQADYLGAAATRDHDDLAAAIAEADGEDTIQVALTAPMAGLESSVVGFEDVVAAEGHGRVSARRSGDLVARIITAVVLIAALAASLVWRPALVGLATVVFIIGAGEFYTALRRNGWHPIALFGFVGIVGAGLGAYFWGAVAIPTSFFIVLTVLLLFYAVVPGKDDPMGNLALTIAVMVWAGLGTFAMLIADSDDYRPLIVGVVVIVAAMDIAQYFVGRSLGRHQLSPWVSPKKTVEGLIGGIIVAFAVGATLHFFPPFELTSGLAIGAAAAVLVPLGDLAMSAAKRSLGLKDMGSILPGHGGFLDRIDGLLFVIPAAWAIFVWAGLL